MSQWHKREISKGVFGELSKIKEELEEAYDSEEQGQTLMLMFELSDIIGACGGVASKYGLTLDDLVKFSKLRSEVAVASKLTPREQKLMKEFENEGVNVINLK